MFRRLRGMICLILMLATSWSLAGAYPAAPAPVAGADTSSRPTNTQQSSLPPCCRDCRTKSPNQPDKSPAPGSEKCMMMQCCRMVPGRADSPALLDCMEKLVWSDPLPPARLGDLSRPADIFRPPRIGLFA